MERTLSAAPHSDVRMVGVSWPLLAFLAVLVGVLASPRPFALLLDGDTYWHLAAGRWIVEHGVVPGTDPFSHSMPEAPWTAHEWLSELVLYGVHRLGGWAGLVVLGALSFAATVAYLMRFLMKRMEPVHALLFTVFGGLMALTHLLARPHVLAWPLLVVWVAMLVDAVEQRRSPPWWMLGLMVLWANLHGSFTLGIALAAALSVDAVISAPRGQRVDIARRWAAFVVLCVLAALLTPSGWQGLWFTFHVMGMGVALAAIAEWRSPDFHGFQPVELWLLTMLCIACAGLVRLPWLRLLIVAGLLHLALKHQRNVAVLGLVSPLLMAAPLAQHWRRSSVPGRDVESLDRVFRALAAPASAMSVAIAAGVAVLAIAAALHSGRYSPAIERTPQAAVEAAMRNGAHGPVLNDYGFGGYLIYNRVPVFIDGRADMYGDAFLKRYIEALGMSDPAALPQLLDQYRIGWTLLAPGTSAVAMLDRLPGWRRVHADSVAVVHVREDALAAR